MTKMTTLAACFESSTKQVPGISNWYKTNTIPQEWTKISKFSMLSSENVAPPLGFKNSNREYNTCIKGVLTTI